MPLKGCISKLASHLNRTKVTPTFALAVQGDAMVGRHFAEKDDAILEHGMPPKPGNVVATYLDHKSALRTFPHHNGKPVLMPVHLVNPEWIPARDLIIQGVMVTLVRKLR